MFMYLFIYSFIKHIYTGWPIAQGILPWRPVKTKPYTNNVYKYNFCLYNR